MADWATISALATGGGTLALAVATFASVRSGNRSARLAEQALQEQRRPVLVHSRTGDATETVPFRSGRRVLVHGGEAVVDAAAGIVYLAMSLRNVGAGIAVLQAWRPNLGDIAAPPPDVEEFLALRRDQYIAAGDVGVLQGILRDPAEPEHAALTAAARDRESFTLDLLYTDQVGGQRTISRFGVLPEEEGTWIAAVGRHWYLDTAGPR